MSLVLCMVCLCWFYHAGTFRTEGPDVRVVAKAEAPSSSGNLPRLTLVEKLAQVWVQSTSRLNVTCSHWHVQLEIQIVLFLYDLNGVLASPAALYIYTWKAEELLSTASNFAKHKLDHLIPYWLFLVHSTPVIRLDSILNSKGTQARFQIRSTTCQPISPCSSQAFSLNPTFVHCRRLWFPLSSKLKAL